VLIPKDSIEEGLANYLADLSPVVLYTCGFLCPIHKQHVSIQERAKEFLEMSFPIRVVGGFLATSNDKYVREKYESSGRMDSFVWLGSEEPTDRLGS
jgi:hypothetical protein